MGRPGNEPNLGILYVYVHVQWKFSNSDTLGQAESVLINKVSCFRGYNVAFGAVKAVLFIEVSSLQGIGFQCVIIIYVI